MNEAEKLHKQPDEELQQTLDRLQALSASSKSTARYDRKMEDGSVLVVTSVNGEAVQATAVPPPNKKL